MADILPSAEYILDVIGAGATATSELDWHAIWKSSRESADVQAGIDVIHAEGRKRPALEATFRSEFATSWLFQLKELFIRNALNYWRRPEYIFAKLVLNVIGGLFIGFTFFKAKHTQQGTQNKLFVSPILLHYLRNPTYGSKNIGDIHGYDPQRAAFQSTARRVHSNEGYLRDPRTSKPHLQLECAHYFPVTY